MISNSNRARIHELIESMGFDSVFDEGDISEIAGISRDAELERLVDDYQIAIRNLMRYIER